jgi:hypothetical protein
VGTVWLGLGIYMVIQFIANYLIEQFNFQFKYLLASQFNFKYEPFNSIN